MGFSSYQTLLDAYNQGQRFTRRVGKTVAIREQGWYPGWAASAGDPSGGVYTGSALEAQQCSDATVGAILHGGNVSALTKHLLRLSATFQTSSSSAPAFILLYDRLLYYPGIDAAVDTNQALVNGVALPRYTDGVGVRCWLEITTNFGANTGVVTYGDSGYTNSAGTTGRQHGVTLNTVASMLVPKLPHTNGATANTWTPFMPLQAGDLGVKSVESIRFTTAHASGACALVLGYPLCFLSVPQFETACERDLLFRGPMLPRIYDGACLDFLIYCPATLNASIIYSAELDFVWG